MPFRLHVRNGHLELDVRQAQGPYCVVMRQRLLVLPIQNLGATVLVILFLRIKMRRRRRRSSKSEPCEANSGERLGRVPHSHVGPASISLPSALRTVWGPTLPGTGRRSTGVAETGHGVRSEGRSDDRPGMWRCRQEEVGIVTPKVAEWPFGFDADDSMCPMRLEPFHTMHPHTNARTRCTAPGVHHGVRSEGRPGCRPESAGSGTIDVVLSTMAQWLRSTSTHADDSMCTKRLGPTRHCTYTSTRAHTINCFGRRERFGTERLVRGADTRLDQDRQCCGCEACIYATPKARPGPRDKAWPRYAVLQEPTMPLRNKVGDATLHDI